VASGSSSTEVSRDSIGGSGKVSATSISSSLSGPSTFKYSGMSIGEVIGSGSVYATSNLKPAERPSSAYPSASAGGDPTILGPSSVSTAQSSSNSYTITVAPSFNIQTSGSTPDLRKMAKEIASMLEQEVRMTMLRSS
jgi:hypothetical protein